MVTGGVDFGSDEDDPSLYEVEDQPAVILKTVCGIIEELRLLLCCPHFDIKAVAHSLCVGKKHLSGAGVYFSLCTDHQIIPLNSDKRFTMYKGNCCEIATFLLT